jgi:hypothetical protein
MSMIGKTLRSSVAARHQGHGGIPAGHTVLGDYLDSGFTDLGYSCEDVEEAHL